LARAVDDPDLSHQILANTAAALTRTATDSARLYRAGATAKGSDQIATKA